MNCITKKPDSQLKCNTHEDLLMYYILELARDISSRIKNIPARSHYEQG